MNEGTLCSLLQLWALPWTPSVRDGRTGMVLAVLLVASAPGAAAQAPDSAQAPDPDPARFAQEIEAFEAWDAKNSFPEDALLFVGSSSIRFWNTAERLPDEAVLNRGFGGAHISDVNHYIEETVLKYAPDAVFLYAGDNDVEAGKTGAQVLEDYRAFVDTVQAALPDTPIVFLAIKPSRARWDTWPEMEAANARIQSYSDEHPHLYYADVAAPLLGEGGGEPPARLFVEDGLHLSEEGYDRWTPVITDVLEEIR